ncbi:transposase family protein [Nonomuraea lactucae]|uniref:transposase family protein n=1 Tax=Nonomuraea lactucae TaxID=2249762 RepID=UPI0013B3C9F7
MFTVGSAIPAATCPSCGTTSARTHGGYRRRLTDLPISGRPVRIDVGVRRFRCDDPGFPRQPNRSADRTKITKDGG